MILSQTSSIHLMDLFNFIFESIRIVAFNN